MLTIRKAAVIGAGTMGAEIAAQFANAGVPVLLLDIVPQGAASRNALAEVGVGQAHYRRLGHALKGINLIFDLLWVHVVAAGNDQVFSPSDNVQVTTLIDLADIARNEVTIMELGLGLFRVAPVPGKDIRSPDFDHAECTLAERAAALQIHDPHFNTW